MLNLKISTYIGINKLINIFYFWLEKYVIIYRKFKSIERKKLEFLLVLFLFPPLYCQWGNEVSINLLIHKYLVFTTCLLYDVTVLDERRKQREARCGFSLPILVARGSLLIIFEYYNLCRIAVFFAKGGKKCLQSAQCASEIFLKFQHHPFLPKRYKYMSHK